MDEKQNELNEARDLSIQMADVIGDRIFSNQVFYMALTGLIIAMCQCSKHLNKENHIANFEFWANYTKEMIKESFGRE